MTALTPFPAFLYPEFHSYFSFNFFRSTCPEHPISIYSNLFFPSRPLLLKSILFVFNPIRPSPHIHCNSAVTFCDFHLYFLFLIEHSTAHTPLLASHQFSRNNSSSKSAYYACLGRPEQKSKRKRCSYRKKV